jgi:hypothetical protein
MDAGGGKRKFFYCLDFTTDGEYDCPICEVVEELYREGDKRSKKQADDLQCQRKWIMNVIVRGQENKGPQLFEAGTQIFKQISAKVRDPDYGADIYDPDDGVDLVITRTGTTMTDTSYDVSPKRKNSPMGTDEQIDEWFDAAADLYPYMLTDDPADDSDCPDDKFIRLMPYDRLLDMFEGLDVEEDDADESYPFPEEDEEEDLKSRVRRSKGKRSSKGRRRGRRR